MRFRLLAASVLLMAGAAFADPLNEMVSPVTDPVNFEDPRSTSEIRPIYIYHRFDDKFITEGGNVQIWALQARYAIDDRTSIIAVKDGLVDLNPKANVDDATAFANVSIGAKHAFYKEADKIATLGLTYEIPMGASRVLQGEGGGFFNPFVTTGYTNEYFNLMASTGFRFRVNREDSQFYNADLHIDFPVAGVFYPGFEFNLIHVLSGGERLPIADEGADFFSLGSIDAGGKNIVTGAAVARVKLADKTSWGIAYQFPMSRGEGTRAFDWRITTDLIFRFDCF